MRKLFTFVPILFMVALLAVLWVMSYAQERPDRPELLGGQTTIFNTTPNAFGQPIPGLERHQELLFFVGNSFFNQNWVTAPASTTARDGLGPIFNARSCASCHFKDGRGRPPEFFAEAPTGLLLRLGMNDKNIYGQRLPEPNYGMQFQDTAIEGVAAEGNYRISYEEIIGEYPDGTAYTLQKPIYSFENLAYGDMHPEAFVSARVANQMIGLGLLEAISEEDLLQQADPNDQNKDGISGRPNFVFDALSQDFKVGRFGWKAEQPTVLQQAAHAFTGDLGITTELSPIDHCTDVQIDCRTALSGSNEPGEPEIIADDLLKVALYSSSLAVPAQRDFDAPEVLQGEELFRQLGCTECHTEMFTTGLHMTIPALSHQTIRPFTDLLLHDMGPGLADGVTDYQATGSEWRTPPLWGIGLFQTVNKHTYYLHDGRARNLEEAILWHGGEAEKSKNNYMELPKMQRDAILLFLNSL